jgi:hypothetical protein
VTNVGAARIIFLVAAIAVGWPAAAHADDIDALFLGGYWCGSEEKFKTENIPRSRIFLLSRRIEGTGAPETGFSESLIDIVGDIRGQRVILSQKLKLADGSACKTDCLVAERIVHKDMLEVGDWNSNTGVFKSNSPREYVYRCDK